MYKLVGHKKTKTEFVLTAKISGSLLFPGAGRRRPP